MTSPLSAPPQGGGKRKHVQQTQPPLTRCAGPLTRPAPLSLRDISPHCGESPLKGSHPLWPHGLTPPGPKTDGSCVVGALCAPVQLNDSARFHGRTLFAPTARIRSDVGGGVLDAPANTRTCRADIESAPTHQKIWPRRGQSERGEKALRNVQHSCTF